MLPSSPEESFIRPFHRPKVFLAASMSLALLGILSAARPGADRLPSKTKADGIEESFGGVEVVDPRPPGYSGADSPTGSGRAASVTAPILAA